MKPSPIRSRRLPSLVVLAALLLACRVCVRGADQAREPNTLTKAEKQAGWKLLFDGKTTEGWRGYRKQTLPPGWKVVDGVLARVRGGAGGKGAGGGDDIVTTEEFENFDLHLEWKTVAKGNSGVLYHVSEEPVTAWHYAPEVQILDNTAHPGRSPKQLAGACYDLYAPAKDATRPVGQWNHMRILVQGAHVEHWLNGGKIVEYELWSEDWNRRVARSKFKNRPKFGTIKKGPICLQDHSDRIEFRNIKIRPLPADATPAAAVSLFNGKMFDGWEGNLAHFRIEDGAIVGGSLKEKIPRNEYLCTTKAYGDFELRLRFKLVDGVGNAGVQCRTKRIPNHHMVIGYQADIGLKQWGAIFDESRRRKVLAGPDAETMAKAMKAADWNDYVIRAQGPRIQLWLNGVQTVDYPDPDATVDRTGIIGLQVHGGAPSEIWYKDLTIQELRK